MHEQVFQATVVTILFGTSVAQAAIHARTWAALGPQDPRDRLATSMRRREESLALKLTARSVFDFILVVLVFTGSLPFNTLSRDAIYVVTSVLALYAVWRGIDFILTLRNENWGYPVETKDHRDERQDAREDGLDLRAVGLDARGWDMSKESIKQEVQQRDMDKREDALDVRDKE